MNLPAVIRISAACLAAPWLAACAGAQVWLADAGWPPFPAKEAQTLLAEASSMREAPRGVEAARQAAEFAYRHDLYSLALDGADMWRARDPGNVEALALVAALEVAAGGTGQAVDAARAALSSNADPERFIDLLAGRVSGINAEALDTGQLESVTSQLVAEFPDSRSLLQLAAQVALGAGQFEQAYRYADRLLDEDPLDDNAYVITATALSRNGDLDTALARLTEQLALRDSILLEQNYAMLLLEGGQPREALSRIRNLRVRNPESLELVLQEARMLRALGAGSIAEPLFIELFARGYEPDLCRQELGRITGDRQEWLESIEWFAGIESEGLAPVAARGLVRGFIARQEYDEALATVMDLVRRHPEHTYESLPLAAAVMQAAGRSEDALGAYDEALRYQPESKQLRMTRAHLLLDLERNRSAIREMEDLLEDHPRDPEILNALGYTLADRGIRIQEAHKHIRLALELNPGSPEIVDSMGWVLYRLGRAEEAVALLEQALESFPHPEVAAHLCEVLFELGQTQRADSLLRESLERYEDTTLLEAVQRRYSQ